MLNIHIAYLTLFFLANGYPWLPAFLMVKEEKATDREETVEALIDRETGKGEEEEQDTEGAVRDKEEEEDGEEEDKVDDTEGAVRDKEKEEDGEEEDKVDEGMPK